MLALLYLPVLAAVHFSAGTALGVMSVLSAKAVRDMRRADRERSTEAASA